MKHFIVFYWGMYSSKSHEPSQYIYGDVPVQTRIFPNKAHVQKEIKEQFGLRYVHITSIKEVSIKEFEEYYK